MVKARAQDAEQEIVEMEADLDHPNDTLSAEMQMAAQQMGAHQ